MNIFLTAFYTKDLGGGETSFINLVNYIATRDDITSITLCVPKRGALTERLNSKIEIVERSSLFELMSLSGQFDLAIHNYMNFGKKFLFLPRLKIKRNIFLCHGLWDIPRYTKTLFFDMAGAEISCVNKDVYDKIRYKNKKVTHLPLNSSNLIDTQKNDGSMNISVIGRYQDIKNQLFAVDVFEKIAESHKDVKLNFIGDSGFSQESIQYKERVEARVSLSKYKDRISFFGHLEPSDAYSKTDLVFVSSKYESFGMVIIEALSMGIPCIAPYIGGPKEIMSKEYSKFLYEPDSVEHATKVLQDVIASFGETKVYFKTLSEKTKSQYGADKMFENLISNENNIHT
ncbi:glycosyltransferase family 4 protein [Vibrio panuliri]|uniref:glycosyltransferase family 4 protein n=1 Tax=Vibrio panuliri TaxID=1381081 RepID=UPI001386D304|nr:glycosyltransferase family 4 protein [Vibrio panuliri]